MQATIRLVERARDARVDLIGNRYSALIAWFGHALLDETPREHAVHGRAQVINIGLIVDLLFSHLLGRHELRCALDPALVLTSKPGRAEVD